jgi:transposase
MSVSKKSAKAPERRRYSDEFKEEAVQMLLDGHSAASIVERLGLSGSPMLYRWKKEVLGRGGATAQSLEVKDRELEAELRRVERERDILKKALAILSQSG